MDLRHRRSMNAKHCIQVLFLCLLSRLQCVSIIALSNDNHCHSLLLVATYLMLLRTVILLLTLNIYCCFSVKDWTGLNCSMDVNLNPIFKSNIYGVKCELAQIFSHPGATDPWIRHCFGIDLPTPSRPAWLSPSVAIDRVSCSADWGGGEMRLSFSGHHAIILWDVSSLHLAYFG